ncbi:MAG: glycosyltransferase involved in cell wall biosynthesis [Planctomycetota bacterium]
MRVARILTRLNLGGPARQALGADPLLAELGVTVRVFCGEPQPGEGDLFEEFIARGIDVVRVPGLGRGISGLGDLRALLALRSGLRKFNPDLIHTHASKAGLLGRLVQRGMGGVASVHSFHGHVLEGYFSERISRMLVGFERRLAARTNRVIAVSHATAGDLLRLEVVSHKQLVVVPPGMELDPLLEVQGRSGLLRGLLGVNEEVFLLGVVGRLAEVKCPARAVDVFLMLAQRHPNLELVFIGDGDQRRVLENRIGELSPEDQERVHMVGSQTQMPEVLSDLDCVMLTSRTEGMPVALIEAGAAGLPCLATDVGGVSEVLMHERTGFVCEGVDELAYALDQLLTVPRMATEMGRRARVRMVEKHSARTLAERLLAVYAAALEEAQ